VTVESFIKSRNDSKIICENPRKSAVNKKVPLRGVLKRTPLR
jgi:hypothetical protein